MTTTVRTLAVALTAALALTACGEAPESTAEPTGDATAGPDDNATGDQAAGDFRGCMVTDQGGVDDDSFNETSHNGLLQAEEELGVEVAVLESSSPSDYEPNIASFLEQDCDLIVTVGFLLAEATAAAAEANPDQLFAIVDNDFVDPETGEDIVYDNVRELTFETDQAAFLAGYVSAGMTETGTLGTYGGLPIPTVTIFMDGYLAGMRHYNQVNDADVELLGWQGDPDSGQFTGGFEDTAQGRAITDQLLANGVDIVMPVAGPVGLGSAAAIEEAGTGKLVWVDTDGCESTDFCPLMLTSVMKNMDVAVFDTMQSVVEDTFEGGLYNGTLDNDGVQIAPFHEYAEQVPEDLQTELDELREGIIAGDVSVDPADY